MAGGTLDGASISRGYDSLLRRNSLTTSLNSTTLQTIGYTYDPYVSRLREVNDGSVNKSTYTYVTDSSLVDTLTHTHNSTDVMFTKKEYDYLNRLTSIASRKSSDNSILTNYAYQYNSLNQRSRATTTDNSYWTYGYDAVGQVTSGKRFWSNDAAVPGQDYGYDFDGIGNRETTVTNGRTSTYATNEVNEIESRTVPGVSDITGEANPAATVTVNGHQAIRSQNGYFYKALPVDNSSAPVWQSVAIKGVLESAPPDGADTVAEQANDVYLPETPEAFAYDDDGNMISDGRWTITWDGENRMVALESHPDSPAASRKRLEFQYDNRQRRIVKTVLHWNGSAYSLHSETLFTYDGSNMVAEFVAGGDLLRSYRWGLDLSGSIHGAYGVGGLLASTYVGTSTSVRLVSYDGAANVAATASVESGEINSQIEYGAFGELIKLKGTSEELSPFLFSSKYRDAETGFYNFGYRFYSPNLGRWLSKDPAGEWGGLNLLAFVRNNSGYWIDTDGRFVTALPGIGVAIAEGANYAGWIIGGAIGGGAFARYVDDGGLVERAPRPYRPPIPQPTKDKKPDRSPEPSPGQGPKPPRRPPCPGTVVLTAKITISRPTRTTSFRRKVQPSLGG